MSTKDDIYELEYDSSELKPIKKRQKKSKIKVVPAKMNRPVLRQRILPVILEENSYSDEEHLIEQIESEDEMPQSKMAKLDGPGTMKVLDESVDEQHELLEEEPLTCSTLKGASKLGRCYSRNQRANADDSTKFGQTTPLLKKVAQKLREEMNNNPGLVAETKESADEEPEPK